ncbi:MAG TPA: TolC family protein [Candidatus Alistipes intestinipullorum]|nr:TolC family protein [Candidatus Alistipes intestinipullorum]
MKRLLSLLLILGAGGASAQSPAGEIPDEGLGPLTLRECLETGLEQNYDIRIVRNEELISDNNATAANAGMVPTIDLEAGYAGTFDNSRETTLRAGGSESEQSVYDQAADVGVAVNWTLFDGFRIRTEYKKLKELQQKGALQTRLTIEEFVATFTAEYYNFVQQTLRLANFRYAMGLSRERMRIAEEWYRVGSSARLDILQARVDFNADSSQYMSQQELVTASRIRLNELLAHPDLGRKFAVRDTLIVINDRLRWDDLVGKTCETNAELLMADRDNAISELELKSIRSRNFPYVKLSTGYGYNYNRYGSGTNLSRGTLGLNAGVQVGFTLFDGNRRREQRNARIAVENTRLTRQQLELTILADLSNFWQAYRNNLEVIELEEENLIAARENYRIAMERYRLGQLSGIEMREAQKSLLDAEERILTAKYNTKLCEISLQQISGNVLTYLE